MPARVLSALRFGLGTPSNTLVDSLGSDGLTPLALSAICGEWRDSFSASKEDQQRCMIYLDECGWLCQLFYAARMIRVLEMTSFLWDYLRLLLLK